MKIAAFDIGGTALKMGVVTEKGDILTKAKQDIPHFSGEKILAGILAWLETHPDCGGIAVSAPGYVNPRTGFITMGGAIRDFDHSHLQAWLSQKTALPVTVENDANCALLAERWLGKARSMSDFLMMTIGTGIGGAIFCNGALVHGHRFSAGEFGYRLNERPRADRLMKYTLHEICTLTVLRGRYAAHSGKTLEEVSGEEIFEKYDRGDSVCTSLVTQFFQDICAGIFNLSHIFDPECIFPGGGITERPQFIDEVEEYLDRYGIPAEVTKAQHGNSAGLPGAVYHFISSQHE